MERKHLIIIGVAILVIAVVCSIFLFGNGAGDVSSESSIVFLSKSAYINVTKDSNNTLDADKKGILYYTSDKGNINITSCSNISKPSGVSEMKKLKDSIEVGSKKINENNYIIYLKDGIYSAFVKNTDYNDFILIQSPSKNVLLNSLLSLDFHDPTVVVKYENTSSSSSSSSSANVVNGIEKTEAAVGVSYSSSTSSSSSSSSSSVQSSSDSYYGGSSSYGGGGGSSSGSGGGGSSSGGVKSSADYY